MSVLDSVRSPDARLVGWSFPPVLLRVTEFSFGEKDKFMSGQKKGKEKRKKKKKKFWYDQTFIGYANAA